MEIHNFSVNYFTCDEYVTKSKGKEFLVLYN
jgi:hypothetical protein